MNKLNKELLERALVEGVDESFDGSTLSLANRNRLWHGFHITAPKGLFNQWQYVCKKEEYLAAKAGKETMSDTKSEYDIGCYYEFSDCGDFVAFEVGELINIKNGYRSKSGVKSETYKYIRPLTAKAGEIRNPKPLSGFLNLDADGYTGSYSDKSIADINASDDRIACIDLSQHNEGEGLK